MAYSVTYKGVTIRLSPKQAALLKSNPRAGQQMLEGIYQRMKPLPYTPPPPPRPMGPGGGLYFPLPAPGPPAFPNPTPTPQPTPPGPGPNPVVPTPPPAGPAPAGPGPALPVGGPTVTPAGIPAGSLPMGNGIWISPDAVAYYGGEEAAKAAFTKGELAGITPTVNAKGNLLASVIGLMIGGTTFVVSKKQASASLTNSIVFAILGALFGFSAARTIIETLPPRETKEVSSAE